MATLAQLELPVTNGTSVTNQTFDLEDTDARTNVTNISNRVTTVEGKIPSGASPSNKMATASDVTTVTNGVIANTKLIKDTVGWSGKNVYQTQKMTLTGDGGLLCAINNDSSVRINGTSTKECIFPAGGERGYRNFYLVEAGKSYIFSTQTVNADIRLQAFVKETSSSSWSKIGETTSGNNLLITMPSSFYDVWIRLSVASGKTISDVTVYPMLRDADILDDTYEPYFGSTAFPRSEQAVLGAGNFLINKGTSTSADGITWTVNADKTVTANGTKANNENGFKTVDRNSDNYSLPSGTYYFSGNPSNDTFMLLQATRSGQVEILGTLDTVGAVTTVNILDTDILQCVLFVKPNKTVSNLVFKPMLSLSADTPYSPYAMTNKELTDAVTPVVLGSNDDLNNITKMGLYIVAGTPTNTPDNKGFYALLVYPVAADGMSVIQIALHGENAIYYRRRSGSPISWKAWVKVEGTVIS